MRRYLIKGENKEQLLNKFATHFKVPLEKIGYEILRDTPDFKLKVWIIEDLESESKFNMELTHDGIFLTVYEKVEDKSGMLKDVLDELTEKEVINYDIGKIEEAIYNIGENIKIADYDPEYYFDSKIDIKIINRLEASIRFEEPVRGNKATLKQVLDKCNMLGIENGIKIHVIESMLDNEVYNKKVIFCRGSMPDIGSNAKLQYLVKNIKASNYGMNKSVDFKDLHLVSNVRKDQDLVIKTPRKMGKSGLDIFGIEIKNKDYVDYELPMGENTYISDDGLTLKAAIDGKINIDNNGIVSIEEVLLIDGNVDYSTGNIEFVGNVLIKGSVLSGFKVKADKDIFIEGVVESADLEAGGDIIVSEGIIGSEEVNNKIIAGHDIKAKFMQNMDVTCGNELKVVKHILHCDVEAKGKIDVTEGKGIIIGGTIKSETGIRANIGGGKYGAKTTFVIGVFSSTENEYRELTKKENSVEESKFKLELLASELKKNIDTLPESTRDQIVLVEQQLNEYNKEIKEIEDKKEEIHQLMENTKKAEIHFLQKVNPGVTVKHGNNFVDINREDLQTIYYMDSNTKSLMSR